MFKVNKKLEYGIIALLYLSTREEQMASVREMAKSCRVPEALLSKIMQTLKLHGFVMATHGNHGGYKLKRALSEINLLDLTKALVGPIQLTECLQSGKTSCPVESSCSILTPMSLLNQKLILLFQGTSVAALVNKKGEM